MDNLLLRMMRHLDLNAIAASLDIAAIAARIDMESIVDRIDLNALAQRLDIEALLQSADLTAMTAEILEPVEVADVIRRSSRSTALEMVDSLRARGFDPEGRIARLIEHLLGPAGTPEFRPGL
jgi:hypothetical protein